MLNVSPRRKEYETLPGISDPSIPARAPLPAGDTPDIQRIVERFPDDVHRRRSAPWASRSFM